MKDRKQCSKCKKIKKLTLFHKQLNGGYLGRRADCIECRGCTPRGIKQSKAERAAYYVSWSEKNKSKLRKYAREYISRKRKTDIQVRLKDVLRNRIRVAIKQNRKPGSAVKDLGCTVGEFKLYLESKFLPGMTWNNFGAKGWHIDHIIPLSRFDLTNIEEFRKACHYTNMQPLWAKDNILKSNH